MVLAYIDARDVQDRLDEVVGVGNWMMTIEHQGPVAVCTLSIWCANREMWISKSDGAGATAFEADKGRISDAFKRAAVHWGIGRYLYGLDSPWVDCKPAGRSAKMADGEEAKLTRWLTKVTDKLMEGVKVSLPEGTSQDGPGEDFEEPEGSPDGPTSGTSQADAWQAPADPISEEDAKRVLAAARDAGKKVGEHGFSVTQRVLKELNLPIVESPSAKLGDYVQHLTWVVGNGDLGVLLEQIAKAGAEEF